MPLNLFGSLERASQLVYVTAMPFSGPACHSHLVSVTTSEAPNKYTPCKEVANGLMMLKIDVFSVDEVMVAK
ncbi:hypothetical protein MCEMAEM4_03419 [Burkholderiaceae bacterium]